MDVQHNNIYSSKKMGIWLNFATFLEYYVIITI